MPKRQIKREAKVRETTRKAYQFLFDREADGTEFEAKDLAKAAGWLPEATAVRLGRDFKSFVEKAGNGWIANGVKAVDVAVFANATSQAPDKNREPAKPKIAPEIEIVVLKARHAALAAIQAYNNPLAAFRTETFAVMMNVAWTALAQAELLREGLPIDQRNDDGTPKMVDGEARALELKECIGKLKDLPLGVRDNLLLWTRIRNVIVHKGSPKLDQSLGGKAQALLLNFENRLVGKFGKYYALQDGMSLPLAVTAFRGQPLADLAARQIQQRHFDEVMAIVRDFESNVPASTSADPLYDFRVWVVPQVGNNPNTAAIQFVRADQVTPELRDALRAGLVAVAPKKVPVSNLGYMTGSKVCKEVCAAIGKPFTQNNHALALQKYRVRPYGTQQCLVNDKYCHRDDATGNFVYSKAWTSLLIEVLADPAVVAELRLGNTRPRKR